MFKLEANEALWDRTLRVCVGIAMLAIGWTQVVQGVWGLALEIFGWVPLVTGLLGWCPIYAVLGLSTNRGTRRRTNPDR